MGEVRYPRAYYYCRHCGHGVSPADAGWHVDGAELTPAARQMVALAGTLSSFAEAAEKVLPRLAGVRVSESTVERTTEAAGTSLGERLQAGELFGETRPWEWSKDACGQTVGYVSLDATGVGIQGPNGAAAEGRMVDVGLIFDPGSNGRPGRMRALAGLSPRAELGKQMRRQAAQVGLDAAEAWVALTDGGAGLDEFMRVYFPRAELVLDFYHAAEHLNDLAQALHPADDGAAAELTCAILGGASIPDGLNRKENHEKIEKHLREFIDFAAKEGVPNVICMSGNRKGMPDDVGLENCVIGLKRVVGYAVEKKVTLCMEGLNSKVDHKDYMYDFTKWGVELCKRVSSERCRGHQSIFRSAGCSTGSCPNGLADRQRGHSGPLTSRSHARQYQAAAGLPPRRWSASTSRSRRRTRTYSPLRAATDTAKQSQGNPCPAAGSSAGESESASPRIVPTGTNVRAKAMANGATVRVRMLLPRVRPPGERAGRPGGSERSEGCNRSAEVGARM